MTTFGQRSATRLRTRRRRYSSTVTRHGLRRQTPPSRSASPHGAKTSSPSSARKQTATAVAVSGQVATPAAAEPSGATRTPKRPWYQVCTPSLVLGVPGHPRQLRRQGMLQRDLPRVAEVHRAVEGQVHVLDPGRIEAAVQPIPDQVAEHPAADPPARGRTGTGGAQHPQHPGCHPDDGLKPSHAVVLHATTLPPAADSAAGHPLRPLGNTPPQPRTTLRAGPHGSLLLGRAVPTRRRTR